MNEWTKFRVEDIAEKIAIGPFGSRMKSETYTLSGVPVIRGTNITGGRNFSGDWVYVSEADADQMANCNVRDGDLVFPHRGAIGEVGIVPGDKGRYIISSSLMTLRCDSTKANSLYLYYFFKSYEGRHELLKNASQVGTPGIGQPLTSLRSIEVCLPPVEQQKRVAGVLSSLDDKIELNRRMNDTLEAMARAIFQSWFIDFDPVRAKAGGETPDSICQRLGMTTELLAQFPETFVESPLGAIPVGWTVCPLDEIADYLNGLALQKFPAVEGDDWLPVIKIAQLRSGHTHTADKASTQVPPAYVVENGDVLFSWSGSLEVDIWCGGRGALNQHLFKVTSSTYPKWFYFLWTRHHLNTFRDIAANKATTMGHIQRKHLAEAMVVCPPTEVIGEMTRVMAPLLDRMVSARLESARLATVRDTLLPELLSGRLEIEDAGKLI